MEKKNEQELLEFSKKVTMAAIAVEAVGAGLIFLWKLLPNFYRLTIKVK